jgi:parallel beta-helix repeat protein
MGHVSHRPASRRLLARPSLFLALTIAMTWAFAWAPSAAGTVYYVAPTGSDDNSCTVAQSVSRPKRTINAAVACLAPGSTLYIRGGVYAETLFDVIPSGNSWTDPVTIAAYPGEQVTLRPAGGDQVIHIESSHHHIVIDGLILDGANVALEVMKITYRSDPADAAHHIRVQNSELMNAPGQGILVTQGGFNELVNLKVHDNGRTDFEHGFYISSDNNLIDHCTIYRNAGWGVHVFGSSPRANTVTNNRIHDNARAGARGPGIGLYGPDNIAFNNIVWKNNGGIEIDTAANVGVYNNTLYDNNGGNGQHPGINLGSISGVTIRNNIVNRNFQDDAFQAANGASSDHNLVGTDPLFVDAGAANFHVGSASPAIDAGVTIPLVTTDADGLIRPRGKAYDLGAFEYDPSPASQHPPQAPRNLRIVTP